jgi:hypothetical protein
LAVGFTRRGEQRFVQRVTGLALNVEEHTVTQSVVALSRVEDWRKLKSFAEYGSWDLAALQAGIATAIQRLPDRLFSGYSVWAGDDTKVPRTSSEVWGTCTFHEYTARCPNRAQTVRSHNWGVLGALLLDGERPALFLPVASRLYCRKSQLPEAQRGAPVAFRTKCALLIGMARDYARCCPDKALGVFDGGFALRSVARPLARPTSPDQPRSDFVTRLRHDAALYALPPSRRPHQRGRTRVWGKRLAPPRQGGRWPSAWQEGFAFVYGRVRRVRYKEVVCP